MEHVEMRRKLLFQVKESWEMNEDEKLEQAEIMKGKGTSFFKVSHVSMTPDVPSDDGEFTLRVN